MLRNAGRVAPRAMEIVTAAAESRVAEAARAGCEAAKSRAPVETGALRDSISARSEGLTAAVYTDCAYAAAVEFGTVRSAPRPFMRG